MPLGRRSSLEKFTTGTLRAVNDGYRSPPGENTRTLTRRIVLGGARNARGRRHRRGRFEVVDVVDAVVVNRSERRRLQVLARPATAHREESDDLKQGREEEL